MVECAYKGIQYYYITNQMGDVCGIVDASGIDSMITEAIGSFSQIGKKVKIVLSSLSSLGGILALVFCDMPDGKIDGKLTIKW